MKDITAVAGYSRQTFYNYFRDPWEVLDYIEERYLDVMFRHVTDALGRGLTMDGFMDNFLQLARENKEHSGVFVLLSGRPEFIEKARARAVPVMQNMLGIPEEDRASYYVLGMYVRGLIPTLGEWLGKDEGLSEGELTEGELTEQEMGEAIRNVLRIGVLGALKGTGE